MESQFDLVIYGATGFTGRLAAQYLMRTGEADNMRIAIAGRDIKKLEVVQESCAIKPTIITADSKDPASIEAMVKQTRVLLSFAGPFALYGEPVIAACAKWGVDYLDITGETTFIRSMIKRYQQQALETGARLISFSGFDSVPADLCVYLALRVAKQRGLQLDHLCMYYQIKGGLNGGTLATALNMAQQNQKSLSSRSSLGTASTKFAALKPYFETSFSRWTAPFFMAAVNKAVVRRSTELRHKAGDDAKSFQYDERMVMSQHFGYLKAAATALMLTSFFLLSRFTLGRRFIKWRGPKPGEGPSEMTRKNGFFRGRLVCYFQKQCQLTVTMEREGDPGNEVTVALACESARLAVEKAYDTTLKGFVTPSIAFGDQLKNRLEEAGFRFKISG